MPNNPHRGTDSGSANRGLSARAHASRVPGIADLYEQRDSRVNRLSFYRTLPMDEGFRRYMSNLYSTHVKIGVKLQDWINKFKGTGNEAIARVQVRE